MAVWGGQSISGGSSRCDQLAHGLFEDEHDCHTPYSPFAVTVQAALMNSITDADWYEVSFSVPWIVHGAPTAQDAINIAVSELGKRVTKTGEAVRNADISVQSLDCAACGNRTDAVFIVAGEALVGLFLTLEVRARSPEESGKVGRRELGPHVPNTPLHLIESPVSS